MPEYDLFNFRLDILKPKIHFTFLFVNRKMTKQMIKNLNKIQFHWKTYENAFCIIYDLFFFHDPLVRYRSPTYSVPAPEIFLRCFRIIDGQNFSSHVVFQKQITERKSFTHQKYNPAKNIL